MAIDTLYALAGATDEWLGLAREELSLQVGAYIPNLVLMFRWECAAGPPPPLRLGRQFLPLCSASPAAVQDR